MGSAEEEQHAPVDNMMRLVAVSPFVNVPLPIGNRFGIDGRAPRSHQYPKRRRLQTLVRTERPFVCAVSLQYARYNDHIFFDLLVHVIGRDV
jgi:hypothetical protein